MKAQKKIGKEAATALHARLADLESADCLSELTWVEIEFRPDSAIIPFHDGRSLLVTPNGSKAPKIGEAVDWTKVDRLLLKKLEQA